MCIRFTGQLRALTLENVHLLREPHQDETIPERGQAERLLKEDHLAGLYASGEILLNQASSLPLFWNGLRDFSVTTERSRASHVTCAGKTLILRKARVCLRPFLNGSELNA